MKVVAFYLPQFHRIRENDLWWGDGFTEWSNVRKAKPLFDGHVQPKIPMGKNYYDLSSEDALRWQAGLMSEYRIEALCFYHYHFGGKYLLERPSELLLSSNVDMPFCFCWANESWTRTWEGNEREILIRQNYGGRDVWAKHIEYLIDFFADRRYVRVDGRPLFLIYKPTDIPMLGEMVALWNHVLKRAGLPPLYLVGVMRTPRQGMHAVVDRGLKFEPFYSAKSSDLKFMFADVFPRWVREVAKDCMRHVAGRVGGGAVIASYEKTWRQIIKDSVDCDLLCSAFVDWDNTARRGGGATVFRGATPAVFRTLFRELYVQEFRKGSPLLFVNAWNEWAEGAFLEPDEKYGYEYLEAIRDAVREFSDGGF